MEIIKSQILKEIKSIITQEEITSKKLATVVRLIEAYQIIEDLPLLERIYVD